MKWMAHESDKSVAKRSPDSSSDETKNTLKLPRYNRHLNRPRS
jgi:hypothetical protein